MNKTQILLFALVRCVAAGVVVRVRENLKADVTIFFPKPRPLYRYSSSAADRGTFRVVVVRTGRVDMCVECE